ncbi:hypothetical protein [Mucilaginibacter sp. PAMB04168]|uniref:hypothetical protein n=1 Tax=Mucilaginibacter sp. PAMB04168 TaxID=3138567 RepID=UPI0031F65B11
MLSGKNILIFSGLLLIIFASLYGFTRAAFWNSWDFSETGQIGDTIGGITAPIINIIGSILIYISFLSQNKANKLQSQQNAFSFLYTSFNNLKEDYQNVTFTSPQVNKGKVFKSRRAISIFLQVLPHRAHKEAFLNNSFFYEYLFLIGNLLILIDNIEEALLEHNDKKQLFRILLFFYTTRLKAQNIEMIKATSDIPLYADFHKEISNFRNKAEMTFSEYFPDAKLIK